MSDNSENFRSSWWSVVFYPESAPDNWIDIIESTHVPCIISPEHNADLKDDGTLKKSHFHLLIKYDRLKSARQVINQFCIPLNTTPYAEIAESPYGSYRYLWHADSPFKTKYDPSELIPLNGFREDMVLDAGEVTNCDKLEFILSFAFENGIRSFGQLVASCLYTNDLGKEYFPYIVKNSYFLNSCLRSL